MLKPAGRHRLTVHEVLGNKKSDLLFLHKAFTRRFYFIPNVNTIVLTVLAENTSEGAIVAKPHVTSFNHSRPAKHTPN